MPLTETFRHPAPALEIQLYLTDSFLYRNIQCLESFRAYDTIIHKPMPGLKDEHRLSSLRVINVIHFCDLLEISCFQQESPQEWHSVITIPQPYCRTSRDFWPASISRKFLVLAKRINKLSVPFVGWNQAFQYLRHPTFCYCVFKKFDQVSLAAPDPPVYVGQGRVNLAFHHVCSKSQESL